MRRPRLRAAVIAATLVLATAGLTSAAVAAPPTASCRVTGDWGGGFQGECVIANPGPDSVSGWTLEACFTPATTQITQSWGATAAASGNCVRFTGVSWSNTVPAGASVSFGFIGSPGGGTVIGQCTLNGQSCAGSGGGSDTTPPSAPGNLRVTGTTSSSVSLAWTASTDDVGVTGYDVFNGDVVLAAGVAGTQTTVGNLIADTPYTLTVRAKDAAGNSSAPSNQVVARTQPGTGGGPGSPTSIRTVSTGWTAPWGIDWLPDGSALVTERDSFGVFRVTAAGQRTQVGTVPNVARGGEGGLLGLAVSPTFAADQQVYLYHTSPSDNRIVRMTLTGNTLGNHTVIVSGIPRGATFHQGGRLAFGPDGFLYAGTGDAQNSANAQNTNSLAGKILRMTRTGQPAPGNPFGNLVYSYGHRNVQGLAWDSAGRLWSAELGENTSDELNLVQAGNNYGWPTCEGSCGVAGMTNPKRTWATGEASPSGIAIAGDVVYMAALRGQRLWRIPLTGENTGTPQAFYVNEHGRLRTVIKVPGESALWLATSNADGRGTAGPGGDVIFRIDLA
ncbi:MAG TPA: PQQ-dependent sugar dehydrogenase [Streptosporangiaceae bacterium]|nr:PQQ-dependent sugar dehydrogenase [Streptosporangiaceae bacterium]